ncbi:RNA polymerase sigma factor [Microbispora triticiradicis]|uniref:RNA polymerase sigma factor n=1 Tax=Microbispora triticiradicis TaxID=2200763 RepID=UPI003A9369DC
MTTTREVIAADDATLIGRSLHEPEIFAVLFDRHAPLLHRYVTRRLGPGEAEDVVADTFLAAFQSRGDYDRGRPDARPWLYGINAAPGSSVRGRGSLLRVAGPHGGAAAGGGGTVALVRGGPGGRRP